MKNLFLIDGASGTGKSDLLGFVARNHDLSLVRKYTTRERRDYEEAGLIQVELEFVSEEEFDKLDLEYQYRYRRRIDSARSERYGFKKSTLNAALESSRNVFVVVRSATVIRQLTGDYSFLNVIPVYIYTDEDKIQERLRGEGLTKEQIRFRVERLREARDDYFQNPQLYSEVLINTSSSENFHRLIRSQLIAKYASQPEIDEKLVFVLMSVGFDAHPELEDHYSAIERAVEALGNGYRVERLDEVAGMTRSLTEEAKRRIEACRLAIVDISYNPPNVYYELGYAHCAEKECLIVASQKTKPLFYPREYRIVRFRNAKELNEQLTKILRRML